METGDFGINFLAFSSLKPNLIVDNLTSFS
jgi:hypothetical protein